MTRIPDALGRLWTADDQLPMVEHDGVWTTWGSVRVLVERIERELLAAGCRAGDRVAVVLGNRIESMAALMAIFRARQTLVTISPLQPPARLSADLGASSAPFVLAPEALWAHQEFIDALAELGAAAWSLESDAVTRRAAGTPQHGRNDPAIAIEMLTSGTTGTPKRIPLTHGQIEASLSAALQHNDQPGVRDKPVLTGAVGLVALPIVHIGGLWSLLQALVAGRRIVMLERFTVAGWHAAVKEHKPVSAGLPPAAIRMVLESSIPAADLASIRAMTAGTSPVDPDLVDAFHARYGIPILAVYGATEFSGAVAGWTLKEFNTRWKDKKGSVGRPFPGVRMRIIGDDGDVRSGKTGLLQVASKQIGNGADWVTTSDLAHIDEEGFLYIDGRADDVIVRGGFKVSPEIVMKTLRTHRAVADAVVVGRSDSRLGQIPFALVEVRNGASATGEELRAHCRDQLTPYEVPAAVFVVDELPRGAALKVDRRRLDAMLDDLLEPGVHQPSAKVR